MLIDLAPYLPLNHFLIVYMLTAALVLAWLYRRAR